MQYTHCELWITGKLDLVPGVIQPYLKKKTHLQAANFLKAVRC